MTSFAVIYQSYLKPGTEEAYKTAWKTVASYFINHCGAVGSCLHKTQDGLWVAYSRWPSKAKRDAAWPTGSQAIPDAFPEEVKTAIKTLKNCLDDDRKIPDLCLDVQEDLFLS